MTSISCTSFFIHILIVSHLFQTCFAKQHVAITDHIVPGNGHPLVLHCQSKDDDLGYHNLSLNQSFSFGFHMNLWGTTLFFCHFFWGQKKAAFKVFDKNIYSQIAQGMNTYSYEGREDGMYFYKFNTAIHNMEWTLVMKWEDCVPEDHCGSV